MNALLITGTDSGVGKTVLTTAIAAYWFRHYGDRSLGLFKPIQCGGSDRDLYARLFGLQTPLEQLNPLYFTSSLLPPLAAQQENRRITLEGVWQGFEALLRQHEFVLVEGIGGFGTPITPETTVADLAWDWRLPALLVVPVKPGAIAQAVAHVALAQQCRVHLKGIILNRTQPCSELDLEQWASPALLQSLTQKPVLGCLPHLDNPQDLDQLAQAATHLTLDYLLPGLAVPPVSPTPIRA